MGASEKQKKGTIPQPPTWFLFAIILMLALHFLFPVHFWAVWPWTLLGGIPLIFGLGISVWGSREFDRVRTTVKPFEQPTHLVTTGPFRLSRHPMYLGFVLVLVGIGTLLGSLAPLIVVPLFIAVMEWGFIAHEERAMEETFGEAHREYRRRVRRWL